MVAVPHLYEILATFLLTGGRKREVLGLAPEDISFERGVVMFRPHPWRSLKTKGSRRNVPLWPQLAEILGPYMSRTDRAPGRLLFPSHRTGGMIHDLRRPLAVWAVDSRGRVRLAVRVFNPAEAEIVTGMLELYLLHWPEPPAPAAVEARPGDSVGSVRVDSEE